VTRKRDDRRSNALIATSGVLLVILLVAVIALHHPALAKSASPTNEGGADDVCTRAGVWLNPGAKEPIASKALFDKVSGQRLVLLGETHNNAEHHRWQLHSLAALHGRGRPLVLGFEMFPRRLQPALERWMQGELSREAFLEETEWDRVWGYDSSLYMPLFDFARMHRIPMIALNVDRSLIARVGKDGWESVPAAEREGVTDPAPAPQDYQRKLAQVYELKEAMRSGKVETPPDIDEIEVDDARLAQLQAKADFRNFVAAQQVWDRAMAQALVEASRNDPDALIVGIMGTGHMEDGFGVPDQLTDLGIRKASALIPVEAGEACKTAPEGFADAVFTVKTPAPTEKAGVTLGVRLEGLQDGARIAGVSDGSVAETSGLKSGDRIVQAAGVEIQSASDMVDVVKRQSPGTWLPMQVKRQDETLDIVAKFPPAPDQ